MNPVVPVVHQIHKRFHPARASNVSNQRRNPAQRKPSSPQLPDQLRVAYRGLGVDPIPRLPVTVGSHQTGALPLAQGRGLDTQLVSKRADEQPGARRGHRLHSPSSRSCRLHSPSSRSCRLHSCQSMFDRAQGCTFFAQLCVCVVDRLKRGVDITGVHSAHDCRRHRVTVPRGESSERPQGLRVHRRVRPVTVLGSRGRGKYSGILVITHSLRRHPVFASQVHGTQSRLFSSRNGRILPKLQPLVQR